MQDKAEWNTHIIYDEKNEKILISPNLNRIFHFLINIENDINPIMEQEKKIQEIQFQLNKLLEFTAEIAQKVEDTWITLSIPEGLNLDLLINQFKSTQPSLASKIIILFSYFETLYSLYIAYSMEIDDKEKIISYAMNSEEIRKFISKYTLSMDNVYFKKNRKYLWKITPKNFRNFRNSLTHFFSVSWWINIAHENHHKKARELEKKLGTSFISSADLYELLKESAKLLLKFWSTDYLTNTENFNRKIKFVETIVSKHWSNFIQENS